MSNHLPLMQEAKTFRVSCLTCSDPLLSGGQGYERMLYSESPRVILKYVDSLLRILFTPWMKERMAVPYGLARFEFRNHGAPLDCDRFGQIPE